MSRQARLVDVEVENPLREGTVFVVLTFLFAAGAYLPLLASARGWISITLPPTLSALGVVSPGLAAIVLHVNEDGVEGLHTVLDGLTAWRFGRTWWAVTLALPPVFYVAVAAVNLAVGIEFSPEPVRFLVETGPAIVLPSLLITVLGAGEEIGWRGYLLPRLQARMGAQAASLLLGVIWFAWHLPVRQDDPVVHPPRASHRADARPGDTKTWVETGPARWSAINGDQPGGVRLTTSHSTGPIQPNRNRFDRAPVYAGYAPTAGPR